MLTLQPGLDSLLKKAYLHVDSAGSAFQGLKPTFVLVGLFGPTEVRPCYKTLHAQPFVNLYGLRPVSSNNHRGKLCKRRARLEVHGGKKLWRLGC
jgi:hypothetical protein